MFTRSLRVYAAAAFAVAGLALTAADDPLADLKAGASALDAKRYPAAISNLDGLGKRLPKLADYAGWLMASARFESRDYAAVPKALDAVWKQSPASPLVARAALLAAQAYGQQGDPKAALEILRAHYAALSQPQGDLAMATAFAASGDSVSAVIYYQRVYYGFPLSAEAVQAGAECDRLRTALGDGYPPAVPPAMLGRVQKLLDAGQATRARKELEAMIPQLGGAERDLARVRLGVADFTASQNAAAYKYLSALEVASPEADAERLFYLMESARRLDKLDEMDSIAARLGSLYPASPQRLQALISAGNRHLLDNDVEKYEPLYRACYEAFPKDSQAAVCHWKVTWAHYLRRQSDAGDLLREELRMFPASEAASGALYFLGRQAEDARDANAARAFFREISEQYPNQYYATVARDRMDQLGSGPAAPAPGVTAFLKTVSFPQRARTKVFDANGSAKARIERSHLLASAGLKDWAEVELRFGAQNEDQPHLLAMELASLTGEGKPDQAIRYIKRYASGYLFLPIDSAPVDFWRLAFPLPYRNDLERYAHENNVDPFLMAALIRQESEFDIHAVSVANARGLTQIEPSTGREISRRLKATSFTTAKLFDPSVNLRFGTYYFKQMTDSLGGNVAAALAAYNAGLSRANAWLKWGNFREPAEFVETVPFTQTRGYIQAVLRNADSYRRIYGTSERASAK